MMTQGQDYRILNSDPRDIIQNCSTLQIKGLVISSVVSCVIRYKHLQSEFLREKTEGEKNVLMFQHGTEQLLKKEGLNNLRNWYLTFEHCTEYPGEFLWTTQYLMVRDGNINEERGAQRFLAKISC